MPADVRTDNGDRGALTAGRWSRLGVALGYLSLAAAVSFVALYVGLAVMRLSWPFELEWMEGGAAGQVAWILSGHKLYGPPSLEFTPWVYPPLFYYLSAAVSAIVGGGFFPLRLLSFASSLGSIALVFAMVRRETDGLRPAILSAGLFAATFQLGGFWFDLARSDSLFLVLMLAAIFVLGRERSLRSAALAGILASLSFFSKQTALVVAIPLALYCAATDWRRALLFVSTAVLLVGGGTLVLDRWQEGWFSYYVFMLPSRLSSRIIPERIVYFWTRDVILPLGIASSLALFYVVRTAADARRRGWFYVAMAAGMFAGAWIPRVQSGGFANTLIPAYAAVSILFGLGLNDVRRTILRTDSWPRSQLVTIVELLCVMQFAALVYNPIAALPRPGDLDTGKRIVNRLAGINGDVFVFSQSYLAVKAGKPATAHASAILDIFGWGGDREKAALKEELRAALAGGRFSAVVLDDRNDDVFRDLLGRYEDAGPMIDDPRTFWPVTGYRVRPGRLFLLRGMPR